VQVEHRGCVAFFFFFHSSCLLPPATHTLPLLGAHFPVLVPDGYNKAVDKKYYKQ
jgi:hypothetical protein